MVGVPVLVPARLIALPVLASHLAPVLALALVAVQLPPVARLFNTLTNDILCRISAQYSKYSYMYLMRETLLIFAGFGTVLGKAFHLWTNKYLGR